MTAPIKNTVVWTEIPVTNLDASAKFYGKILGAELTPMEMGPSKTMLFPYEDGGVAGNLYVGKPAPAGTGNTIHFSTELTPAQGMKLIEEAGGKVVSEAIELPDGKFFYFTDLDGNSIGLYTKS